LLRGLLHSPASSRAIPGLSSNFKFINLQHLNFEVYSLRNRRGVADESRPECSRSSPWHRLVETGGAEMTHLVARISMVLLFLLTLVVLSGCGSDSGSFVSAPAPSPPTAVSAARGGTQATITWAEVPGASSYNIYWSTTSDVSPAAGTKIAGVTSPYTVTGLTNGVTYYFVVCAVNGGSESAQSTRVSAVPGIGGAIYVIQLADGVFSLVTRGVTGMAGVDLTVGYDTSRLANPRVVRGNFATTAMTAIQANIPGQIRMAIIQPGPMSGSGTIATISFDQLGNSAGNIALSGYAINSSGNLLPVPFLGWTASASSIPSIGAGDVANSSPDSATTQVPISVPAQH
jgi:hypothetical protein